MPESTTSLDSTGLQDAPSAQRSHPAMSPPRLLLIDDHTLFRTGLRMVLANGLGEAEFNEASSLEEAMRADTWHRRPKASTSQSQSRA